MHIQDRLEKIDSASAHIQATFDRVSALHGNLTIIKERALELNRIDASLFNEVLEKSE